MTQFKFDLNSFVFVTCIFMLNNVWRNALIAFSLLIVQMNSKFWKIMEMSKPETY